MAVLLTTSGNTAEHRRRYGQALVDQRRKAAIPTRCAVHCPVCWGSCVSNHRPQPNTHTCRQNHSWKK